eukprot:gene21766-14097_t
MRSPGVGHRSSESGGRASNPTAPSPHVCGGGGYGAGPAEVRQQR